MIDKPAPAFTAQDQNGMTHTLSRHAGSWILLYFYPKDDTPGCTKEACAFRNEWDRLQKYHCVVLGVSTDDIDSHAKFAKKYALPFPLLADDEKKIVQAYGVWGEKQFLGKRYMGTSRTSFLIDPSGILVKIYEHVKPDKHVDEVLQDLRERRR